MWVAGLYPIIPSDRSALPLTNHQSPLLSAPTSCSDANFSTPQPFEHLNFSMNELVIEAGHTERNYWRDLFRYRELFYFLAWRDVLVRYKQTVIGVLWAVLRPLLQMVVFTFIFNKVAKLPAEGVPYPVMVFGAMLPWQLFATSLSEAAEV